MMEVTKTDLFFMLTKAHWIHDFFHIEVHFANVETKFIHYHLQFVLELPARVFGNKITFKDGMWKNLVPRDTFGFMELQTAFYKVLSVWRQVFSFD